MFTKGFQLIFLPLFLWISQTTNATDFNCNNLKHLQCKLEFGKQFEEFLKEKHFENLRIAVPRLKETFEKISNELPADEFVTIKFKNFINELNFIRGHLDNFKNDSNKIIQISQHLNEKTQDIFMNAQFEKLSEEKFKEILKRNNFLAVMGEFKSQADKTIKAIGEHWNNLYSQLRISDLAEYPKYKRINAEMKALAMIDQEPMLYMTVGDVMTSLTRFLELSDWYKLYTVEKEKSNKIY